MSLLSVHGLALEHVPGVPLLSGVRFEINAGDRIGLAGPNGCGKSTLLRALAGELAAASGRLVSRRGLRVVYLEQEPAGRRPMSSGEKMREALAAVWQREPDLLLLDEPTNHLDSAALEWLERMLSRTEAAVVVVSHHRAFLDRVTERTFWIERGRLEDLAGGYSEARRRREQSRAREWAAYEGEQRRVAAAERAAERREALARKVDTPPAGARLSRDFYGRKAGLLLRTARILRERKPARGEVNKPWEEQRIPSLTWRTMDGRGAVLLRAAGLDLRMGSRVVVSGPNGSGKTTLLKRLLAAEVAPRTRTGYLAQEGENVPGHLRPVDLCPDRTLLACLKLPAACVERPCRTLSAGERTKTRLAQLLHGEANVLLLDEPTNHLEIEAQEALEQALRSYPGALVLVSHDETFVRNCIPEGAAIQQVVCPSAS